MTKLRIAVLVSVGVHPVSGAARWSRNDALALSLAQEMVRRAAGDPAAGEPAAGDPAAGGPAAGDPAAGGPAAGGSATETPAAADIDVIHAGDPAEPALRDYLALGAACVDAIEVPCGRDVLGALVDCVRGYSVVLCGTRAEGGEGSGLLPYLLAQALHVPLLPAVLTAQLHADSVVTQQFLPKGRRREVASSLPAVLAVHPLAPFDARHVYARQRAGQVAARVARVVGAPLPPARVEPAVVPPVKLAARESRSGRTRLLAATTMQSRGGAVITQGTPVEKAQAVIAYLRRHSLIDY